MIVQLAVQLGFFSVAIAQEPDHIVISFPSVPAYVYSNSPREVAWTKQITEYFIVEDVEVLRSSHAVVVEPHDIEITGSPYPFSASEPYATPKDRQLFKHITSRPHILELYEVFTVPKKTIKPGYRYLAYMVKNSVTKYERRVDPENGEILTRRKTVVSYSLHSIIVSSGQSFDPRSGRIYTGKDLNIPRWPEKPTK